MMTPRRRVGIVVCAALLLGSGIGLIPFISGHVPASLGATPASGALCHPASALERKSELARGGDSATVAVEYRSLSDDGVGNGGQSVKPLTGGNESNVPIGHRLAVLPRSGTEGAMSAAVSRLPTAPIEAQWPKWDGGPGAIGAGGRPVVVESTGARINQSIPMAFIYDPRLNQGQPYFFSDHGTAPMEVQFIPRDGATCALDGIPVVPGQRYALNHGSVLTASGSVGIEMMPSVRAASPSGNG